MVFTIASAPVVQRFGTRVVVGSGLLLTAIGLALNALLLEADTSYPVVLAYLMVLAAGMAATMAPATDSIMGSVPPEKAGVGSAVNDTTRELGGALGVAVIGSLMSARYSAGMSAFFAGPGQAAPDDVATASTHQLGAAIGIAHRLGDTGTALADAARVSFMNGWTSSLLVAAVVALVAAGVTFALLPSRVQPRPALAPADAPGNPETITSEPTAPGRRNDQIPTAA